MEKLHWSAVGLIIMALIIGAGCVVYDTAYTRGQAVGRQEVITKNTKLVNTKIGEAYTQGCSYAIQQVVELAGLTFNDDYQTQVTNACNSSRSLPYYNMMQ